MWRTLQGQGEPLEETGVKAQQTRTAQIRAVPTAAGGILGAMLWAGAAAGQGHEALVITNPADLNGLWITNEYVAKRAVPPTNVLWMDPGAASFDELVDVKHAAMFGAIESRRLGESIDYIILGPGTGYRVPAPGLVSDQCPAAVEHFGLTGAYTLAKFADLIRQGGNSSLLPNGYYTTLDDPRAFDAELIYENGAPGGSIPTGDLFIAASLGYSGQRGVNAVTMIEMIDRSLLADPGTLFSSFSFMVTPDVPRTSPRSGLFNTAVQRIINAGGVASTINGVTLPASGSVLGLMTGDDVLDFSTTTMTLEPGSFADHLTSFAAHFDVGQQTKISEWIRQGATGSFGTVEEPCNFPDKFPAPYLHAHYYQGLTLGEAALRSLRAVPFQGYLMGDPLCRPFATGPTVSVSPPAGAVSAPFVITPSVAPTRPGTSVASVRALVDGVVVASGAPGAPLTVPVAGLDDGWHELRVVAIDDTLQEVSGEWVGSFVVQLAGKSAELNPSALIINRTSEITFDVTGSGGTIIERRVMHLGRVIAADTGSGVLASRGEIIGPGPAIVWAEVDFADGTTARSLPVTLDSRSARPTPTPIPVVAYSYTKTVEPGRAFVAEFTAVFTEDVNQPSYQLLGAPAQATLLGGEGPYRIFAADAGATGSDTLTFSVTNGLTSDTATVTIRYESPASDCPADVNGNGVADPGDFTAWVAAYNLGEPAADQNGNGVTDPGDFSAWVANYNIGCPG
ncbi:MAG: GC-type dockerin domain-anchored protein [Phycisphaerales bacterium]